MSTPDHLMNAYVAGLDLLPVQMGLTATGAEIGRAPLTGVPPSHSVILYCKRHSNIERMMAGVRSEFADAARRATLSELVSAVLNSAAIFGISILTETEVHIMASDAVARMETELEDLQLTGGFSAINRSVQNDTKVAETGLSWYRAILAWLDNAAMFLRDGSTGCWRDHLAILYRAGVTAMSANFAIIGPRWAGTIGQLRERAAKWVKYGELLVGLLRRLVAGMLR